MALVPCKECNHEVSDAAKACPGCGARVKPASKAWMWIVGIPAVLFVFFAIKGHNDPHIQQMQVDRKAIDRCMDELDNPLTPMANREFIRGTCAMMTEQFTQKYGRKP